MTKLLCLLIATLFCTVPFNSYAMNHHDMKGCKDCSLQQQGTGHMDKMGEMMGMCLDNAGKIGLGDDQLKKLTPLHREMKKNQVRFNADLKIAEMELVEIMEVKDFDLEKANAAVKKIAELKTAHHMQMIKAMKEVRAALTDEQFGKMKKMMHQGMKMGDKKPVKGIKHAH